SEAASQEPRSVMRISARCLKGRVFGSSASPFKPFALNCERRRVWDYKNTTSSIPSYTTRPKSYFSSYSPAIRSYTRDKMAPQLDGFFKKHVHLQHLHPFLTYANYTSTESMS